MNISQLILIKHIKIIPRVICVITSVWCTYNKCFIQAGYTFFFILNNMQQETALTSIVKKKKRYLKSQKTLGIRCIHAEYSAELEH